MTYNPWVKIDTFKMPNKSRCYLLVAHKQGKKYPEIRLDYGCLCEWPIYDETTDRILWDHPERFTKNIINTVEKLYRKLYNVNQED